MRSLFSTALLLAAALAFVGCGPAAGDNKANTGKAGGNTNKAANHDDHDHDHDHDHGEAHSLGKQVINGVEVAVSQVGDFKPNAEWSFRFEYGGKVKAVRAWVGLEDGTGTAKAAAHQHGEHIDVHIDTAGVASLPEGAQLWVEVETESGKQTAAFKLAEEGHDHDHDDHDHDH